VFLSSKIHQTILYEEVLEKAGKQDEDVVRQIAERAGKTFDETQSLTHNHQDKCRLVETFSSAVSL